VCLKACIVLLAFRQLQANRPQRIFRDSAPQGEWHTMVSEVSGDRLSVAVGTDGGSSHGKTGCSRRFGLRPGARWATGRPGRGLIRRQVECCSRDCAGDHLTARQVARGVLVCGPVRAGQRDGQGGVRDPSRSPPRRSGDPWSPSAAAWRNARHRTHRIEAASGNRRCGGLTMTSPSSSPERCARTLDHGQSSALATRHARTGLRLT